MSIDPKIFGTRLKNARKMAGLSLQELANRLDNDISKQAISKYELGSMKPSPELVFRISKALEIKPDYLIKSHVLEIGEVSFRKKANLSKVEESVITEKAKDYVERYLELESLLGIENKFSNPLSNLSIQTKEDLKKAANDLRSHWNLGTSPIFHLVEMLEHQGIKVQLIQASDSFDGLSAHLGDKTPVVVVNISSRSIERIRFTIIHELAHILLNLSGEAAEGQKAIEASCHYFSSCFLLPEYAIHTRIGKGKRSYIAINELIHVKEEFGLSIKAIVHRLKTIGMINDTYYKKWMVYMSKTYGSKNEPGSFNGKEKNERFKMLLFRALAEGLISFSKAASIANRSIEEVRRAYLGVK